jgi:hypothetical protein
MKNIETYIWGVVQRRSHYNTTMIDIRNSISSNCVLKHVQVPVQSEVLDKVENTILFCVVIHIHAGVQAFEFN